MIFRGSGISLFGSKAMGILRKCTLAIRTPLANATSTGPIIFLSMRQCVLGRGQETSSIELNGVEGGCDAIKIDMRLICGSDNSHFEEVFLVQSIGFFYNTDLKINNIWFYPFSIPTP
jgi:hypothetical protein